MRILKPNAARELELQLVQETSQQLTFQRGIQSQSEVIKLAWYGWVRWLILLSIFDTGIFFAVWKSGLLNHIQSYLNRIDGIMVIWAIGIVGMPIALIIYNLLKSHFIIWTFDRLDRVVQKVGTNLFGQQRIVKYPFAEIDRVEVVQDEDSDNHYRKCCELYISLKSGKQITLSQSCYTLDRRLQAIALQQHREIAEKMRNFLGHITTEKDKAEGVYIPTIEEIERDKAADWDTLKSAFSLIFSSKEHRQTQINDIRSKIATDRENPHLWEKLSLYLATSQEHRFESIQALRQAEKIYRDRGDETKANELAKKLAEFKGKI
jgi:hypothetical protein